MISYTQRNASAKHLAAELYYSLRERDLTVWLDVKMSKLNEDAMKEAAQNSKCIVAVVSGAFYLPSDLEQVIRSSPDHLLTCDPQANAYFKRDYCVKELRWAHELGKPIIPCFPEGLNVGAFLRTAPPDLAWVRRIECIKPVAVPRNT